MASIRRFEDIVAWQKARQVSRETYTLTRLSGFKTDYDLKAQIRDAANSIMANIAEGFGRGGNKEFVQFLSIANGSVCEVQSHCYVALDQAYISQEQFDLLYAHCETAKQKIGAFMGYLQQSERRGLKYDSVHEASLDDVPSEFVASNP
ncbi:MAG: four helix bundle protein [Kiritimatiellae bacterium]|nr:four helix bundle protein [Kiritimatiellia bacterium]MDD4442229.1 four helix bundle protein [Kiritimatiellia bacterium]